jgi:glyoxylase-like metal-dependent hydrolase (beta-lactamase superfamily II)
MEITPHVYFYQGLQSGVKSWSNTILIIGEKKQILVDPGSNIQSHLNDLTRAMAEDEKDISKINEIWLTHIHPDHAELAGLLLKMYKIEVTRCHSRAGDVLKDPEPIKKFFLEINNPFVKLPSAQRKKIAQNPFFWRRIGLRILFFLPWAALKLGAFIMERIWGKWLPASNVQVFAKEETVENNPDIKVLFLPGHCPDEIGFWIEKEKVLIIGDLINISQNREVAPSFPSPQSNFQDAISSLEKIRGLPIEILIPAHGHPIFSRDGAYIKKLLTKIINRMECHRKRVKEVLEKEPDINIDQLCSKVLNDLPTFIATPSRKQYMVSILENVGYYKNGNGDNGNGNNGNNKSSN